MNGTGAGAADSGEDLRKRLEALVTFAPELKDRLKELAIQLKEKAYNYHKEPPEDKGTISNLRRELGAVYEELRSADRGLLDVAHIILEDRYDQQRLGIAKAQLRSFLDDVYGDADAHLSAAIRIAGQPGSASALDLAQAARYAANAYLRFADTFEEMAEVIGDMADRVSKAHRKANEQTASRSTGSGSTGSGSTAE